MDRKTRQQALDNITPEEFERVKAHQASTKGAFPVDKEWLLLAEFAKAYGWGAYLAVKNDEISGAEMLTLIEANRKLEARRMFEDSQSAFIGAASAQTKKPSQTFTSLTRAIVKKTKADE